MSFKIFVFAAAVLTCQVNAQVGGIIRPFATGFTNGISEMAKPFVQLGQSVMTPATEFITGNRRPSVSEWMSYPAQMIPQAQASLYDGYEAFTSAVPGANYFQVVRPPTVIKPQTQPQTQYFQIPSQSVVRPPRPYPAPAPAPTSSVSEESSELYRPSNLLVKPATPVVQVPRPEVPMTLESKYEGQKPEVPMMTLEGKFEVPKLQSPLTLVGDNE